jgi:hypothetical protein
MEKKSFIAFLKSSVHSLLFFLSFIPIQSISLGQFQCKALLKFQLYQTLTLGYICTIHIGQNDSCLIIKQVYFNFHISAMRQKGFCLWWWNVIDINFNAISNNSLNRVHAAIFSYLRSIQFFFKIRHDCYWCLYLFIKNCSCSKLNQRLSSTSTYVYVIVQFFVFNLYYRFVKYKCNIVFLSALSVIFVVIRTLVNYMRIKHSF